MPNLLKYVQYICQSRSRSVWLRLYNTAYDYFFGGFVLYSVFLHVSSQSLASSHTQIQFIQYCMIMVNEEKSRHSWRNPLTADALWLIAKFSSTQILKGPHYVMATLAHAKTVNSYFYKNCFPALIISCSYCLIIYPCVSHIVIFKSVIFTF